MTEVLTRHVVLLKVDLIRPQAILRGRHTRLIDQPAGERIHRVAEAQGVIILRLPGHQGLQLNEVPRPNEVIHLHPEAADLPAQEAVDPPPLLDVLHLDKKMMENE